MAAEKLVELWRGSLEESSHLGHAVICDGEGKVLEAWGNPDEVIFSRSSCKMIQALPLIESGAAAAFGLTSAQLALACASHNGALIHTDPVGAWLRTMGLGDADLRCGPQIPDDRPAADGLVLAGERPCQIHNNCSGKHAGFLTLSQHLKAGAEYIDIDHPVQRAVLEAFESATGADSPGYGLDGCSAPNHAGPLSALGAAMGRFASARDTGSVRERAMVQLREAMALHPDLVAGEGRACTALMRAAPGVAVKTGAEAVFVAILPEQHRGIAVKIVDGATRASEAVITALLVRLGALDANHPTAQRFMAGPLLNRRGLNTGFMRVADSLLA